MFEVLSRRGFGESDVIALVDLDRLRGLGSSRRAGAGVRLGFGIAPAEEEPQQRTDGDERDDRKDPDEGAALLRLLLVEFLVLCVLRIEFAAIRSPNPSGSCRTGTGDTCGSGARVDASLLIGRSDRHRLGRRHGFGVVEDLGQCLGGGAAQHHLRQNLLGTGDIAGGQRIGGSGHGHGIRGPALGLLLQEAVDEATQRFGHRVRQRRMLLIDLGDGDRDLRVTGERTLPGQCLIGDDAQGVEVGAGARALARGLLRCQVLGGAHDLTGLRQRSLVCDSGDAEVGDLDPEVRCHEDVAGFDVAVDDADLVGRTQRLRGLGDDAQSVRLRQGCAAFDDRRQCLAGHVLHDEIGGSLLVAVVEDAGDSGVGCAAHVLRLGAEACEEGGVREVFVLEDLRCDLTAEYGVDALPDLSHTAHGDARGELVSVSQQGAFDGSHFSTTASIMFLAIGPATVAP